MKLIKSIVILILITLLFSCEPDNNETVITGSKNDNLEIVNLNPVISLPIYPSNATDSLDLNGDNLYEIKFIKSPKPALTGFATETLISTKNKTQILLSVINDFPDSIPLNTRLEADANWSSGESSTYILQSFYCNSDNCPAIGNFINVTDKFIGYKIGKIIGWIKIDNSASGDLIVKEYTAVK
jgi:hypothetical protein